MAIGVPTEDLQIGSENIINTGAVNVIYGSLGSGLTAAGNQLWHQDSDTEAAVSGKYTFSKQWGTYGSEDGQFKDPTGIALDSSGRVYVVDTNNNRVQKFQLADPCPVNTSQITSGVCFVTKWGTFGSGNGQFNVPIGIALDSSGRVYVVESSNNRIQMFTSDGEFIGAWGTFGSGNGQFKNPTGIALDSSGRVYVVDTNNNRVQKFQLADPCPVNTSQITSGVCFVTKWGTQGNGPGQFSVPNYIAVDSSGGVYVVDNGRNRIQMFTSDGAFIMQWGLYDSGDGQFRNPQGIAIDSLEQVYVADGYNHRIQKFQLANPCPVNMSQITSGVCFVTKWGTFGSGNGQFNLPYGIALDSSGRVYVVDIGNQRIQVFVWKDIFTNTKIPNTNIR